MYPRSARGFWKPFACAVNMRPPLTPWTREALATRRFDEYGKHRVAASDAVWALARDNDWYRGGRGRREIPVAAVSFDGVGTQRGCVQPDGSVARLPSVNLVP